MATYNQVVFFTKAIRAKPTSLDSTMAVGPSAAKMIFDPSSTVLNTRGGAGSRVDAIVVTSTSTTQKILMLQLHNNSTGDIAPLGFIVVPAGAGTNGSVAAVSGLNRTNLPWLKIDANGNPYINLNAEMSIEAYLYAGGTALASGETIGISVLGADYDA